MANEIEIQHTVSALTLYAIVRNSIGQPLTISGLTFGAYATASLSGYKIALTEQGTASRFYSGDMPVVDKGQYGITIFQQLGGSPAETDTFVGGGNLQWNGTEVFPLTSVALMVWTANDSSYFGTAVSIGRALYTSAAPGSASGHMIAGTNAATTFGGLTTGALSCTTFTASGAVAFQSTFAVTGTTTFNAFTVTNATTLSGAVSLGSTFTVAGTATWAAWTQVGAATWGTTTLGASSDFTSTQKTSITTAATAATPTLNATQTFNNTGTWTGNIVGTVSTLTTYTGNTPQTGDSFARIGANGAGLTAIGDTRIANLDAAVSSRMATYTQPTGFLAAAFPGTVASTTNITAGTITTVTNVTNAPTNGDFTATMKTSLSAATPAVTVSDKTGFSLTAAYDAAKTASQAGDIMKVSSGTGANQISLASGLVTVGTNNDKTGYTVSTVTDKTGYALTSAYDAAKTAAQAGDAMTLTMGTGTALVSAVASAITSDHGGGSYVRNTEPLDAGGVRVAIGLASANLDTQLTPLASLTFTQPGFVDVNIQYVNDIEIKGTGTAGDPWNPV